MNSQSLFYALLHSESEDDVLEVLESAGYGVNNEDIWVPLGKNAGNFSVVGNQQENPAAAIVEKVVNSIDAVLMGECYRQGIDPESDEAPSTMQEAVDKFFNVSEGRLDDLTPSEQTNLAQNIHVVATGEKKSPCYLIVDKGEGQSPEQFPDTFLSTSLLSPKARIDFVQGKFNAGGSGSLQFCGQHNIQLIVSRRQPYALSSVHDCSNPWGFTVVRRRRPFEGERSSVFVYLAPEGNVLRFNAKSIKVLPGDSRKNSPSLPYGLDLDYGTSVKLYNYEWNAKSLATTETRRQLEHYLHNPCLPFRVSETRNYQANYYAATVIGVWNRISMSPDGTEESPNMEDGFPATAQISLRNIGKLPIRIGVWNSKVETKRLPTGVFFLINGQVHGQFGSEFASRRLKFDYIRDHLLVSVDCTRIERSVAEDLFMASRDRLRKNEHYSAIRDVLAQELSSHQGLKDLNAKRQKERVENAGDASSSITNLISELIRSDPGLAHIFGHGGKIITSVGPGFGQPFEGKRFPTFFRLTKEPKKGILSKFCPINRTVKLEFETDAENDYFDRAVSPGEIGVDPSSDLIEASNLWNGKFTVRFRVPWDACPNDVTRVRFSVSDVERQIKGPFISEFELIASPESTSQPSGPQPEIDNPVKHPQSDPFNANPSLRLPEPVAIQKHQWCSQLGINGPYDAFRIKSSPDGEGYDFYVNVDCAWLITELSNKKNNPERVRHWFTWGLALAALGMIRNSKNGSLEDSSDDSNQIEDGCPNLDSIGRACDGLAQVIVPMFRVLYDGPPSE